MAISSCKITNLPKIIDTKGNISFIETHRHILLAIKRVYYLYDVPNGEARLCHAHLTLHQILGKK